jgi:RNA polymerase sigma-70 factor, ECF subfamily
MTGGAADAEDALQEVFVAVSRALPSFRGESRVSTWLYRIAIRAALEAKARNRRCPPPGAALASAGGEEALVAREEARRLAQAMERLPAEQRAVLALFAIDGLRHRQIAEGTVWSRLNVARRKLALELQAEDPGRGAAGEPPLPLSGAKR